MARLIDDMLDFAKAQLGGGFQLDRDRGAPLSDYLDQMVRELRDVYENPIETRIALTRPVNCDLGRIAQVASNLVANAVKHGAPNQPIRVAASTDETGFELTVANKGDPIDGVVAQQLFHPLLSRKRSVAEPTSRLGLYIASEIARAHGGKIEVNSSNGETRFTLRIPAA